MSYQPGTRPYKQRIAVGGGSTKRQAAAKTIQKFARTSKFQSKRNSNNSLTYVQGRLNSVFPQRVLTRVTSVATFYVPSGTASAQYYCTILSNSFYQPFNSGSPYSGANFGTAVNTLGGLTTDAPSGYNDALSYYTYYKVHKYKIEVECMPTNNADPVYLTVASYNTGGASNINTLSQQEISESAWASSCLCQLGLGKSDNKITQFVDCKKILGYSEIQYKGLGPSLLASAPNANQGTTTGIRWETANNTALTATLIFQVKLTQWVDLGVPDVILAT